jgi:hypothetical protein
MKTIVSIAAMLGISAIAGISPALAENETSAQHFHLPDMGLAVTIGHDGALSIRQTADDEKPTGKTLESWTTPKGDMTTAYLEFQLPGLAAPANPEDSPTLVLRKINGRHPAVWKDEVDEDGDEEEYDMPGVFTAKAKRDGFQQVLDATSGKPGSLDALEYYGPMGEIEPNKNTMPPFVEWQSGSGAAYELIRPRPFATTGGRIRGFEAFSLSGQDTSFSPAFEIHLHHPGMNLWIEIRIPLQNDPSIAQRRIVPSSGQTPSWARRNYDLLKTGFDGPEYQAIRDKIEKIRTLARSLD